MDCSGLIPMTERTGPVAPDDPEMQYHRESALDNLEKAFNKYKESDYSEANWKKLVAAYEQGIADINAALPAEDFIENNIIAALNKALAELKADGTIQSIIDKYIPSK